MVYQQDAIRTRFSRAIYRAGFLSLFTLGLFATQALPVARVEAAPPPGMTAQKNSSGSRLQMAAPSLNKQLETELEGTATRPPIPMLPQPVPDPITPDPNGIVGLHPDPDQNLGIGQLRPEPGLGPNGSKPDLTKADWLRGVALPIYSGPNGEPWGWLINGWLIPNGQAPIAIGRDATFSMVEATPGLYSFPVLSIRPDGWFSFQYTPAGVAWSHISQLEIGPTRLTIESWVDQLRRSSQVEFRKPGISQALRQQPDENQPLVSLVSPNSVIQPLEVKGDWMRVRVTQPAANCQPLAGANSEEGWMRWRDSNQNLLVWFLPQGC